MGPMSEWPAALLFAIDLIDRAQQPMLITWGPDRLIFYNEAYRPILDGKSDEEGQPIRAVFAEAWDVIGSIFARAEAGESAFLQDVRVPLARGGKTEDSWWTLSYSRLPTAPDEGPGVLCVVYETTRLHVAEERVREAQIELERIADLVPSLLWKADGFGRTTWQNGRLAELASAHEADAGTVWRKLMHPEDIEGLLCELAAAKACRRPFSKAVRICMANRVYRWHQVRSEPTLDDAGNLIGWYGVATDIQDVRDAIMALEERSAVFNQFATNAAAMLWVANVATGVVTRLTPNFEAFSETSDPEDQLTIDGFVASVVETDRPSIRAGFDKAAAGEVVHGRFKVSSSKGIRVLQGTTFPIMGLDGGIPRLGGILTDLTREDRSTIALIDGDAGSQNRLSHGLRKAGLDVVTFETVEQFAAVAQALTPGPVVFRHRSKWACVEKLGGVLRTLSAPHPWIAIRDVGGSTREAVEIMRLGAFDVLEDSATSEDLVNVLRMIGSSARPLQRASRPQIHRLTTREHEIAKAIAAGGTNKTIGLVLGISPRTVETHRSRLMERLGVATLAELVALVTAPSFAVELRS